MKRNDEKENLNQYRRSGLEGLDEIRHRQDGLSKAAKRRNGESTPRIHEAPRRCIVCKKTELELQSFSDEDFTDCDIGSSDKGLLKHILWRQEGNDRKYVFMCKWCYHAIDAIAWSRAALACNEAATPAN